MTEQCLFGQKGACLDNKKGASLDKCVQQGEKVRDWANLVRNWIIAIKSRSRKFHMGTSPMDEDSVGENKSSDDEEDDEAGKANSVSSRISVASSGFGYKDDEEKEEEEKEPQEDTKQNPKRV